MNVLIEETKTGKLVQAKIERARKKDMPLKKNGWRFNWRQLYRKRESSTEFYVLKLKDKPDEIQGIVVVSLNFGEMVVMDQVETAPWNYGKNKRYEHVVGCLIAFACKRSFEIGKGNYVGFLSFESKTNLIPLYVNKYGAIWTMMGAKMFFDAIGSQQIIKKYLHLELNNDNDE